MAPNPHQSPFTLTLTVTLILLSFSLTSCQTIHKGFSTSPNPPSPSSSSSPPFQPILTDPTAAFSFGFLPSGGTTSSFVDLVVLHLPSSFPLWRAAASQPIPWSTSTSLSFDGSRLLLSHPDAGTLWSTPKVNASDAVLLLLSSSNLQIQESQPPLSVLWQSFDFPSDSIVQDQNLTSESALVSSNGQFSLRLGPTYLALHMEQPARPMYWKHTAQQAKAQIIDGDGPIYARVDPTGFLGLYQKASLPVDVISFDTFNAGVPRSLGRLTLGSDGNLKAYYWNNGSGSWVSDFVAIPELCDLPAPCGPYGLCDVDGKVCGGCVDNRTTGSGCFEGGSGDFCGGSGGSNGFRAYRRAGVDLVNKELIGFDKVGSVDECEGLCESNCSCWGAVYSNVSGYCYRIEYPVQTVLAVGDERKVGYFKVRNVVGGEGGKERRKRAGAVLVVVGALALAGGCGFAGYRVWKARGRSGEDEMGMMSYKDLKSSSFQSIELSSNSFKK